MILAFDTSAAYCAAALLTGDTILATRAEDMTRGQAERLVAMLENLLSEAALDWSDLTRIAVGIGPGNFTGIRISVSCARGLAMGLGIPAIGVSTFDAIRWLYPEATAAVPAPRDQIYVQTADTAPFLSTMDEAGTVTLPPEPSQLVAAMAHVAAHRPLGGPRPAPLYLKPADAAPARDTPPVILDDA